MRNAPEYYLPSEDCVRLKNQPAYPLEINAFFSFTESIFNQALELLTVFIEQFV